jgi:hypothetical protein
MKDEILSFLGRTQEPSQTLIPSRPLRPLRFVFS